MAQIWANGSNGHHRFRLNVTESSTSLANNTSTIYFVFAIEPIQKTWDWEQWGDYISYVVTINGTKYTGTIPNYDGSSHMLLKSVDNIVIPHNEDGSKTISYSFSVTDTSGKVYTCGNASASGTMALTNIPRYLTITALEITSKTETSVVVKWDVSDPRTSTYYSLDNGANWIGSATDGEYLASDGKSGTFNILNLAANTTYNMKVKIKKTDSGLWTESGIVTFTTYNYPHCTKTPNFVIGDALTLELYNPLGRSVEVIGFANSDNSAIFGGATISHSITGFNDELSIEQQYKSIPNSTSGTYRVVVSSGDVDMTTNNGNTYQIRGYESPTINAFDYIDSNSAIVAITGDNTRIVQNKSMVQARFHAATPNYGAGSIKSYIIECNGFSIGGYKEGAYDVCTVDSASDVQLKLTAYDSRGMSTSKSITVKMLAYDTPKATVELERLNNYEDESYLTVDGSVSSVDGKNTMAIKYRYKVSGGSYGSFTTISDRAKQTLSLDKNNSYIFNVVVTDSFGETFDSEFVLNKGTFPLFIDTEKNSVGINCFPKYEKSLEINGLLPPVATSFDNMESLEDITDKLARSGFYTVNHGDKWYNLINLRHRNGEEDGQYYGTQIRNEMITFLGKLQVRNHQYNGWGQWRTLQEEGDVLFEGNANTAFALSDNVTNYSYLEIFYSLRTSGSDYFSSVKVHSPNSKRVSLIASCPEKSYPIHGMATLFIIGTSCVFLHNNTFVGMDMSTPAATSEMYVAKVIGYR